jgi:isopentenyl-diphosphate delta-isomerase
MSTEAVRDLVESVGADALCVHLNPAMEIVQSDGDRDFRGVLDTLARLHTELAVPVIAKETGCGLSMGVARRLKAIGIRHVDVSGAGGTSWVAVEAERAQGTQRELGDRFREWGIPTAASVAFVVHAGFRTIFATGGIATGIDVARSVALGASAAGLARIALQELEKNGRDGARKFFDMVELELKTTMLLTGSRTLDDLRRAPRLVTGDLAEWIRQAGG